MQKLSCLRKEPGGNLHNYGAFLASISSKRSRNLTNSSSLVINHHQKQLKIAQINFLTLIRHRWGVQRRGLQSIEIDITERLTKNTHVKKNKEQLVTNFYGTNINPFQLISARTLARERESWVKNNTGKQQQQRGGGENFRGKKIDDEEFSRWRQSNRKKSKVISQLSFTYCFSIPFLPFFMAVDRLSYGLSTLRHHLSHRHLILGYNLCV